MVVNWGYELGIDMRDLLGEHPSHPDQLRLKRIINKRAQTYWARERFLARLGDSSETISKDTGAEPKNLTKKRAKVGRYDFTDRQLQIAMASLGAHNSL